MTDLDPIIPAPVAFPANIVQALKETIGASPAIDVCVGRPLRTIDVNASLGIYAVDWTAKNYILGQDETNDSEYHIRIQVLIKHAQEDEGLVQHSMLSKYVRAMVVRDATTRQRLAALSETSMGITERFQKAQVRTQRFLSNEIQGEFLFLSTMDLIVTVEAV